MKKTLLTAVTAAFALALNAQSYEIYTDRDVQIMPEEEVHATGSMADEVIMTHFKVKNVSSNPMPTTVRIERIQMPEESYIYFCWGVCGSPATIESPSVEIPANSFADGTLDLDVMPNPNMGADYRVALTVFGTSRPTDSIRFFVNVSTLGIDGIDRASGVYPNPATSALTVEGEPGDHIAVYNVIGQLMIEATQVDAKQQLDVSGLERGMYLVARKGRDGALRTHKLILE